MNFEDSEERGMLNIFGKKHRIVMKEVQLDTNPGEPRKTKHVYTIIRSDYQKTSRRVFKYSATGLVDVYFPFEGRKIAEELSKKYKTKYHKKYHKKNPEEILWMWIESAILGTAVHDANEKYIKEGVIFKYKRGMFDKHKKALFEAFQNSKGTIRKEFLDTLFTDEKGMTLEIEFQYFLNYHKMMEKKGYKVFSVWTVNNLEKSKKLFASEIKIFNMDLDTAGTCDALYYSENFDQFILVDFKRTEGVITIYRPRITSNKFLGSVTNYLDVFKDIQGFLKEHWYFEKYVRYSLQLGIYDYMFRDMYGRKESKFKYECNEMHIVRLWHEEGNYQLIKINPHMFLPRIKRIAELISGKKIASFLT